MSPTVVGTSLAAGSKTEQIFRGYIARLLRGETPSDRDLMVQIPDAVVEKFSQPFRTIFDEAITSFLENGGKVDVEQVGGKENGGGHPLLPFLADLISDDYPPMEEIETQIREVVSRAEATAAAGTALEFPEEVMTGVAGYFARIFASVLEPAVQFFYFSFLTCLGLVLTGKLTLDSEIRPPPRFFTLLLGESGDTRKSTAITKTIEFFKRFVQDFPICLGVGSGEGLQTVLKKSGRVVLALDELKMFVAKCRIEGSVLLPCVTTLFESTRYHSTTKNSTLELEDAHLAILAASTLSTYETMFTSAFIDIGLLNRLWLVVGRGARRFSIPGKIPEVELQSLRIMLGDVLTLANEVGAMPITQEAREIFDEWYLGLESSVHAKRLDTYALRLMPLLAVNDMKREVDAETVRKAIRLCDHQLCIRQLHDPVDTDNKVAAVETKIRRVIRSKNAVSERDLKRALHVDRIGLWIYNTAKMNLVRAKEIRFDKQDDVWVLLT